MASVTSQRTNTHCTNVHHRDPSAAEKYLQTELILWIRLVYKVLSDTEILADRVKPDIENIRGLNLVVVKLTIVRVTKLPLWHKIRKIDSAL
jgi:hypothetical protein